jgi:transposase-like protein
MSKNQERHDGVKAADIDSTADTAGEVVRGRPGRRSTSERREAVMSILAGKASVDQVAKQYGVHVATVQGWVTHQRRRDDEADRRPENAGLVEVRDGGAEDSR